MVKADQIPEHVWHTAMSTYHKTIKKRPGTAWQEAIAAAINAWPGAFEEYMNVDEGRAVPCFILPKEASDD